MFSDRAARGCAKGPRAMETESVMDKFRAATEKVMIVNTIRHPGLGSGIGRADVGKALKHS